MEPTKPALSHREILLSVAKQCLGTDASPNDIAPDEYGCAETVNAVHTKAFGVPIGGDVSTYRLYIALQESSDWVKVDEALPGDIIISPTGFGKNQAVMPNGHAGYVGENGVIMSNESASGKFAENYTMESWRQRYEKVGKYPVVFFRRT